MHTPGAQVSKCVHAAAKMCTPGAGCTLNFEHCMGMKYAEEPFNMGMFFFT